MLLYKRCITLTYQTADEDGYDGQRADIADQEPEDTEKLRIAAEGSAVGEFVIYVGLLETPADKEDGQKTAESHEDVGRKMIEEVEYGPAGYLEV